MVDLSPICVRPVAHRGLFGAIPELGSAFVPENSMPAFERAKRAAFPVELDVRLSYDGIPVVFHDDDMERLCGREGRVEEFTAARLGQIKLVSSDATIPRLVEVLDLLGDAVGAVVEIKTPEKYGPLEAAVAKVIGAHKGFAVPASFSPRVLAGLRLIAPKLPRGLIATDAAHYKGINPALAFANGKLWHKPFAAPHFLAYDIRALPHPKVDAFRAQGGKVLGWTARNPADFETARRLTDNPVFEGFVPAR